MATAPPPAASSTVWHAPTGRQIVENPPTKKKTRHRTRGESPADVPLVSIVLPTYNGARYLRQSLDSCLHQTYANLEVIVVDDGSSDETGQIIGACTDGRLRYLRHVTNCGLPCALNTGFAQATGQYLTWTSDDNLFLPEAIETMVRFAQAGPHAFVFCDYYRFQGEGPAEGAVLVRLPDDPPLDQGNCIGYCFLYSRQVKDRIGDYDPRMRLAEDYDYWIRISKQFPLAHLAEPLYLTRFHDNSLYATRYWEVKVIDFLLRLKHGILDTPEVARLFIHLVASKRRRLGRVRRPLAQLLLGTRVERILAGFRHGQADFEATKHRLQRILQRWPG
jgi:glycosyltransferase involved in cell wall biosynthesis